MPKPLTYGFDLDGDGAFDDTPSPAPFPFPGYTWTFPTGDPVTVAIQATDPAGRSTVRTLQVDPITENLGPVARLFMEPVEAGQSADLYATGADPDDTALPAVAWDLDGDGDYDDGTGSTASAAIKIGVSSFALRLTDAEGATGAASRTFTTGTRAPVASFAVSDRTPDVGQPITLTSTATDPDGDTLVSSQWDLDDDGAFDDTGGGTATATFATGGVHLVGLKVRDAGGDTGIAYVRVRVTGTATPMPTPTPTPTPQVNPGPGITSAKDTSAPVVTVPRIRAPRLAALVKSGLPVRVGCSEPCALRVVAKTGSRELGRATRSLTAAGTATLRVKLTAKAKRAVRRQRSLKVKLTITAADFAGNRRVTTRTVSVRR